MKPTEAERLPSQHAITLRLVLKLAFHLPDCQFHRRSNEPPPPRADRLLCYMFLPKQSGDISSSVHQCLMTNPTRVSPNVMIERLALISYIHVPGSELGHEIGCSDGFLQFPSVATDKF